MTLVGGNKPQPSAASMFHPQNQPKTEAAQPIPTMTNQSILEPLPPRDKDAPPEELAADIEAKPLTMPEFASDVQAYLANQGLAARWIFTDRRRYAQAKAQGFRNCSKTDLKPGYATLTPFEEEGGTKYINGDLILMVIDRKRYLGALRYKHELAANLSKPSTQRAMSARKAYGDMGGVVHNVNYQRAMQGQPPVMSVFDPSNTDLAAINKANEVADKEIARLGHEGKPDMFTGEDVAKGGK